MTYGDGSWQLTVFVTDLQVERSLRVRGDLHIGGVMIKLVDSLGKFSHLGLGREIEGGRRNGFHRNRHPDTQGGSMGR